MKLDPHGHAGRATILFALHAGAMTCALLGMIFWICSLPMTFLAMWSAEIASRLQDAMDRRRGVPYGRNFRVIRGSRD